MSDEYVDIRGLTARIPLSKTVIEEQIAASKARKAEVAARREEEDRIKLAKLELARAEADELAEAKLAEIAAAKGPRGIDWDALTVPDGRLVVVRVVVIAKKLYQLLL